MWSSIALILGLTACGTGAPDALPSDESGARPSEAAPSSTLGRPCADGSRASACNAGAAAPPLVTLTPDAVGFDLAALEPVGIAYAGSSGALYVVGGAKDAPVVALVDTLAPAREPELWPLALDYRHRLERFRWFAVTRDGALLVVCDDVRALCAFAPDDGAFRPTRVIPLSGPVSDQPYLQGWLDEERLLVSGNHSGPGELLALDTATGELVPTRVRTYGLTAGACRGRDLHLAVRGGAVAAAGGMVGLAAGHGCLMTIPALGGAADAPILDLGEAFGPAGLRGLAAADDGLWLLSRDGAVVKIAPVVPYP